MKSLWAIVTVIPVLLLFCAGCTLPSVSSDTTPVQTYMPAWAPDAPPVPASISIRTIPKRYIPLMSTTVGIRLEPEFKPVIPVIYTWSANYGYFVSWNKTNYRVTVLDANVQTTEPDIYWSYPPDDMGKEKPPVTVRLIIKSAHPVPESSGKRGAMGTGEIRIGWEDNDTAIVFT